jgi:hypothetical protein
MAWVGLTAFASRLHRDRESVAELTATLLAIRQTFGRRPPAHVNLSALETVAAETVAGQAWVRLKAFGLAGRHFPRCGSCAAPPT